MNNFNATVPKNDGAQKYQRKHDMTGTFILVKPNPILLRLNTKPVTLPVYTVYVTVTWQYIWHNIWCYHNAENIEYILSFRETTSYIITVGFLQYSHSMTSSFYQYWIMLEYNMIYKKPIKLYYMMPTNLDRNDLVTKKVSLLQNWHSLLTAHKVQFWTKSYEKPLYPLFDQRHKAFSMTPISGKVRKGSL